jgi:acetate kinase
MTILVLNAGSTSLKFAVYDADEALGRRLSGSVSGIGQRAVLRVREGRDGPGDSEVGLEEDRSHLASLKVVLELVKERLGSEPISAVAHRIVHGGREFSGPVVVDDAILERLRRLMPLAPLHQPFNLAGLELAAAGLPDAFQVAAFDTAFHTTQREITRRYALPSRLTEAGVVRYGFHGLSYEHVAAELRRLDPERGGGRAIAAHLGGGASLCAMLDGRSVASTMGFTALDGVPMGTRVGDLDPGAVLYFIQQLGMPPAEVARVLYDESGLLGVSGVSGDMKVLLASADPRAAEAVELFVYRIAREIGSLAAALGGLDTLVFTGGIGENAAAVRRGIVEASSWLGAVLDRSANSRNADRLDVGGSVTIRVIAADEERVLAQAALQYISRSKA